MPFQAVAGAIEVTVRGTYQGQACNNVLHYSQEVPVDYSQLSAIATAVETEWRENMMPHLHTGYHLVEVNARSLESEGQYQITVPGAGGNAGSKVGDGLPPQVALCITLRTGLAGRSYRGRVYVGALPEGEQNGGVYSSSEGAAIANAIDGLRSLGLTPNAQLAVLSRQFNGQPRNPPVVTIVSGAILRDTNLDTMRRRARR